MDYRKLGIDHRELVGYEPSFAEQRYIDINGAAQLLVIGIFFECDRIEPDRAARSPGFLFDDQKRLFISCPKISCRAVMLVPDGEACMQRFHIPCVHCPDCNLNISGLLFGRKSREMIISEYQKLKESKS